MTRRQFLGLASLLGGSALGGAALSGCLRRQGFSMAGEIAGQSHSLGHMLLQGRIPPPSKTVDTGIIVVGSGVAGLCAGWKLDKSGFKDFLVIDLEAEFGGNARWGENEVSRYPWAAHYLPFPRPESRAVSELLADIGVELGRGPDGKPVYDERAVCFAPQERLFIHGAWHEGLFPRSGATAGDVAQLAAFNKLMEGYRRMRDGQGRPAFAIPMELSSRREDLIRLDTISMADWLKEKGLDSPRLRWFVDYACRDDFGTTVDETSAWAGIHYHASRGADEEDQVLTWPEGNGYITAKLCGRLGGRLLPSLTAFSVDEAGPGVAADCWDSRARKTVRVRARAAVVCVPLFVARRIVGRLRREDPAWLKAFRWAPWMVANLTVNDPPPGKGFPTAWDNVIYASEGLGYVVADHQSLGRPGRRAVWTYYRPLTGDPVQERRAALGRSWQDWRDIVLADLSRPHPRLAKRVSRLDVMVLGHAMVKPGVGLMWGPERRAALKPLGRVFLAHSDLSGFSIFEEAQYRGVLAAQRAMALLGRSFTPSV